MNNGIDFDEWEQSDNDMCREDQLDDFYDQLRAWAQKNAEAKNSARKPTRSFVYSEPMRDQTIST